MEFNDINELDEAIYSIPSFKNRSNLSKELQEHLPFYVVYEDKILFRAESCSKKYFRDKKGITKFVENGEPQIIYPENTEKIPVNTDQIICKTLEDAEMTAKVFTARKIKERWDNISSKYHRYKKFREDNPEFFI